MYRSGVGEQALSLPSSILHLAKPLHASVRFTYATELRCEQVQWTAIEHSLIGVSRVLSVRPQVHDQFTEQH